MLKRIMAAAAVPAVAIGLASFLGTGTASASANLTHADCVGIAASTTNAVQGTGAGGALISAVAKATGGVALFAHSHCPRLRGGGGTPS